MASISRRARSLEYQTKLRIVKIILLTLGLFLFFGFFGPKAVVQLSLFSEGMKPASETASQINKIILLPPKLDPLPQTTRNKDMTVSGTASANSEVEIFINEVPHGKTKVREDGSFSIEKVPLTAGINQITARAHLAPKESELSEAVQINYKNELPKLTITEPENHQKISGGEAKVIFKGQTDPDVQVFINNRIAVVDQRGYFEYLVELKDGENTINMSAKDEADNETKLEYKIIYNP